MWTTEELAAVSPLSVQKRIGFTINYTEVANYIGNLLLAPDAIPTNARSKHIMHAILKEVLTKNKTITTAEELVIEDEVYRLCPSDIEAILVVLDSYNLPDLSLIKNAKEELPLSMIMQIHPLDRELKGVAIFDWGLSEKQTLHLSPQKLLHVPIGTHQELNITITITKGKTSLVQSTPIPIVNSKLGLIIDTRDTDILVESTLQHARELVSSWMESMDIKITDV